MTDSIFDEFIFTLAYIIYESPVMFVIFFIPFLLFAIFTIKLLSKNLQQSTVFIIILIICIGLGVIGVNIAQRQNECNEIEKQLMFAANILENYKLKYNEYPESLDEVSSEINKKYNEENFRYEKYSKNEIILKVKVKGLYVSLCYTSRDKKINKEGGFF